MLAFATLHIKAFPYTGTFSLTRFSLARGIPSSADRQ
jgi:hypothetical protein